MSQFSLYAISSVILFSMGLYGLVAHAHLVRKILALNIMGSSIFLLLVSATRRGPQVAADPVPHALVLTGIVVTVSATAFALVLTRRVYAETGHARLPEPGDAASPGQATESANGHTRNVDYLADPVAAERNDTGLPAEKARSHGG